MTEAANESKVEESPSTQKDEKKEKVKKKRSFRSFSFLRREKKTKEENNKNGDVAKEVSPSFVSILWCAKMETMARYWLVRPHALLFIPAVDACFPFQRPTNMHDGVIFFLFHFTRSRISATAGWLHSSYHRVLSLHFVWGLRNWRRCPFSCPTGSNYDLTERHVVSDFAGRHLMSVM